MFLSGNFAVDLEAANVQRIRQPEKPEYRRYAQEDEDVNYGKTPIIIVAAVVALLFCGVGLLFRKKDIFEVLNHPLAKKYPNLSKTFGTALICFALIWLCIVTIGVCST